MGEGGWVLEGCKRASKASFGFYWPGTAHLCAKTMQNACKT